MTDCVTESGYMIGFDVRGTENNAFSSAWDCACGIVVGSDVEVTGSVCEEGEGFGLEGEEEEA